MTNVEGTHGGHKTHCFVLLTSLSHGGFELGYGIDNYHYVMIEAIF